MPPFPSAADWRIAVFLAAGTVLLGVPGMRPDGAFAQDSGDMAAVADSAAVEAVPDSAPVAASHKSAEDELQE